MNNLSPLRRFRRWPVLLTPFTLLPILLTGMGRRSVSEKPATLEEKKERIATQAEEWEVQDWFNSEPLRLKALRGKVVLVRFWTAPHCPFCAASAPALNEFYEKYHRQGLEVIGFYHHKSPAPLDAEGVRKYSEKFGFKFPVAIDYEWKTLKNWWLQGHKQGWTSVSFLIDKKGVIRHIHTGGQYVKGDPDYRALQSKIEELLREPQG